MNGFVHAGEFVHVIVDVGTGKEWVHTTPSGNPNRLVVFPLKKLYCCLHYIGIIIDL